MDTESSIWPTIALTVVLPLIAFGFGLAFDFGEDVPADFYSAVAQIIPVLFLALLIEMQVRFSAIPKLYEDVMGRLTRHGTADPEFETDKWMARELGKAGRFVQFSVVAFAVAAALGEGAALYALAADDSTTFLAVLSILSLVVMLYMLTWMFLRRFTLSA